MRRTSTTPAAAALLLLCAGVVSGCGSSSPQDAPAGPPLSTATETTVEPTTTASSSSAGPFDDSDDGDDGGGDGASFVPLDEAGQARGSGTASITGVRTGQHDGYERVVLDLQGAPGEEAGWFVTSLPQPVQEASREPLDVDGDRFLDLSVTGIANGADGQVDSAGREAFTGDVDGGGDLVEEVLVGGAWEGQAQVLVGLDADAREYRVLRLDDPQRIVVDVR